MGLNIVTYLHARQSTPGADCAWPFPQRSSDLQRRPAHVLGLLVDGAERRDGLGLVSRPAAASIASLSSWLSPSGGWSRSYVAGSTPASSSACSRPSSASITVFHSSRMSSGASSARSSEDRQRLEQRVRRPVAEHLAELLLVVLDRVAVLLLLVRAASGEQGEHQACGQPSCQSGGRGSDHDRSSSLSRSASSRIASTDGPLRSSSRDELGVTAATAEPKIRRRSATVPPWAPKPGARIGPLKSKSSSGSRRRSSRR